MEAYVHGISARSVDDLVVPLGADSGISKSEVSRICEQLDESVGAFRSRPLDHTAFPYVYLDATYLHVHDKPGKGGQVVSMAVVVATGIAADGSREVLGLDVGDSEDETFWRAFLLRLKQRGLAGVRPAEVLVFTGLPNAHWRKIWSINPLDRAGQQGDQGPLPRRGHLSNAAAVIRMVGAA